jgi:hypothetical protein
MAGSVPFVVRVRVRGELGSASAALFADLAITRSDDGTTLLEGAAVDQSAVHGILDQIRDLGLSLVSVETAATPIKTAPNGDR